MCHLVLMMPLLGLGLFWVLPFATAMPIYTAIFLISGAIYYILLNLVHLPAKTGREGLIGQQAEVIEAINPTGYVRLHGEIWKATAPTAARKGEVVQVIGVKGLTLATVRRK